MNTVEFNSINPANLVSVDDMSMYLFLMHRELVDDLLEYITIFTDDEMIQEIVNLLDLDVTGVIAPGNHGPMIVGYLTPGSCNA